MRWHLDHGERVPRDICAGCRRPFRPGEEILDLADGSRVHAEGYACLIRHGERWRRTAQQVIAHFDRGPWGDIPDPPPASPTVAGIIASPDITARQAGGAFPCPQPVADTTPDTMPRGEMER